jgi:hypothetical protein
VQSGITLGSCSVTAAISDELIIMCSCVVTDGGQHRILRRAAVLSAADGAAVMFSVRLRVMQQ